MGFCVGGVVYFLVMIDFIFMVKDSLYMFVIGFDVVKIVINEVVMVEQLGGVFMYMKKFLVVDGVFENDVEVMVEICCFVDFLLLNNCEKVFIWFFFDDFQCIEFSLDMLIFDNLNQFYDMKELILKLVDEGDFYEIQKDFVGNIVIGFIWLEGQIVGVVVNQFMVLVGCLDIDFSCKVVWFVCFCDVFEILILMLVDVLGFLLGIDQEYGGVIKYGVKLLFVYGEVMVFKVMVIICKVYGGVYDVMVSKYLCGDFNYVWFMVEIVVMGVKGVVEILYCSELGDVEKIVVCIKDYEDCFVNFFVVVEKGFIDEVIQLCLICRCVVCVFVSLCGKWLMNFWKKYDNILLQFRCFVF